MSYEESRTAYDHARAWLCFLIDHPDKTVSVADYAAQLKAAKDAYEDARATMMAAWS